jgi:type I restriction enzyme, S subunit
MSTEFLKYTIDNLVIQRSGSAIPQLTVPMIKEYKIPVPTNEEQQTIVRQLDAPAGRNAKAGSHLSAKTFKFGRVEKERVAKGVFGGVNN